MILLIAPIPLHLIPQLQISLLRTVTYTPKRTVRGGEKRNFTTKKIISIFPLWTLPGCIIPEAPAYGVYISKLIRYSKTCGSYQDFLDGELLPTRKLLNLLKLKSSLRHFSVPTMTLLTLWNIYVTNDHGYVPLVACPSRPCHHVFLITGFVTRITRWVSLVE